MIYKAFRIVLTGIALTIFVPPALVKAQTKKQNNDTLYNGFRDPGNAARPRVWYHWMNGNISKEGIRHDLQWMHRAGIGGFQTFDAGLATPQIVEKRLAFMTPGWKDAFRLATKLADSLKLEMAISSSPGWSSSGGPWVNAEDGMKKIVWSEVVLKGGQPFKGQLPAPPSTTGLFQNILLIEKNSSFTEATIPTKKFYKDIAVIAYRLSDNDVPLASLSPKITSSGGNFSLQQLTDGDMSNSAILPKDDNHAFGWIQYDFDKPQLVKAISIVGGENSVRTLQSSDDGINFKKIAEIPSNTFPQQTVDIEATRAKFFRITFPNPRPGFDLASMFGGTPPKTPTGTPIAELVLYPVERVNRFEEKSGFAITKDLVSLATPSTLDAVVPSAIIDLTDKMDSGGHLNWTAPAGNWKIVRFGYSLTGKSNHPAAPEATGLEVDKMDKTAMHTYYKDYLSMYKDASGGLMGKRGLQYIVLDSYEAGQSNWTPQMISEFKKRRGYDLVPWLPVLTGTILGSAEVSDRFLRDYRQTIAELIAENYDQVTDILKQYQMKRYTESHESGRVYVVDGMDVKRRATVPMSAMWAEGPNAKTGEADIRESASVAHIYGQNIVAAESFTTVGTPGAAWGFPPERLKPVADLEMASGLNRFVVHTSVHQPTDDKIPGVGLGPFGQWFTRHDTWAEQARSWTDYLARSCYLLQKGRFVADVVCYYGDDNNIVNLYTNQLPAVPKGYSFDFINSDALLNLLSVRNGNLVTPSGMSYKVLYLDENAKVMSIPVLRKIAQLVKAGATISGIVPESMPGLSGDVNEFKRLVNEIWTNNNARVFTDKKIPEVLATLGVQPDFAYADYKNNNQILYVHRKLPHGDIFWLNNRDNKYEKTEANFRVSGLVPELWHPETGKTEALSYKIKDGHTYVPLNLLPQDAFFVVFRTPASKKIVDIKQLAEKEVSTVKGPWEVSFQTKRGAPPKTIFDSLVSFTENKIPGIKYFSGTAEYKKDIELSASQLQTRSQIWMDLGDVENIAQVTINGKFLGTFWKRPFLVDVTKALKTGDNKIEIKVTNLWINRLIGDAQPGVTEKITYTSLPFYRANSPLKSSGLIGPVKLIEKR